MRLLILLFIFLSYSGLAFGVKYQGRFSTGAFLSNETLNTKDGDIYTGQGNDFLIFTGRLYFSAQEMGESNLDTTVDLRDKYNSFEVLDKRSKTLAAKHTFQVRQMFIGNTSSKSDYQFQLGRFQILQGAYSYVDGLNLQKKFDKDVLGIYGGYNPVLLGKNYLDYNDKAMTYGAFYTYTSHTRTWNKHFQNSTAFAQNTYEGQTDRSYLFNSTLYQWQAGAYFWSQFYLDFIPRTYVQNGLIFFQQPITEKLTGKLGLRAYDIVQYRRVQNIREKLQPSPYQEIETEFRYKIRPNIIWDTDLSTGERQLDDYNYHRVRNTLSFPRLFSKEMDGGLFHFWRQSFTNVGHFVGGSIGYYARTMEYDFFATYGEEKQTDNSFLHPIIIEGNMAWHFSRTLFSALSLQAARDEKSDIMSLFFKLTYRFGNTSIAPIRDGAAPRGRL